ncbi:MAG: hypothetical protein ACKOBM_00525 [Gammaproteobacteria bacterium]
MFQLLPFGFRFRGRTRRLHDLYHCFVDHPGVGLHPTQISRHTGIPLADVTRCLDAAPELFVRLPKRPDGVTRYRLTSSMAARSEAEVVAVIARGARRESLVFYCVMGMILCLFVIIAILVAPAVS